MFSGTPRTVLIRFIAACLFWIGFVLATPGLMLVQAAVDLNGSLRKSARPALRSEVL